MAGATVVIDADVLGRHRTGDETYVAGLLAEAGLHHNGLDLAATTRYPALVPQGVRPIPLPAVSQMLRMTLTLPRALYREHASLAHFQYVVPPAWRGQSVITVHDLSFERHPEFFSAGDRFLFQRLVPRSCAKAEKVFTVSQFSKDDLVERYGLPEDKVVVTPNGVNESFGVDGPRREGRPYVLFVGAIQPRKDPLCAVQALSLLDGDTTLIIAGPEERSLPHLRRAIDDLGLTDRVEFLGHLPKDELAVLYRGAMCLVFPSRYEGFGLPALEAMACGTPVVAADASALPEVVGDAGILFEPGHPEALADGVQRAMASREFLVAAGIERAKLFRWSDVAATTLAVYKEIL